MGKFPSSRAQRKSSPRGRPVAPRRGAALISSNGSRTKPVRLGPLPQPAAGSQQHPARSFPFGSRSESSPPPTPPSRLRLRLVAKLPNPPPALNFPVGRRHGTATFQPGSFFHPLFQSSGRNRIRSWALWEKHLGAPKPPPRSSKLHASRALATAARSPSPTSPQASTSFPSNLQQSWPQVAVALSGAAHLAASARPRAGTGSAGGFTGPTGLHGVADQPSPPARPTPRLPIATPAPRSQAGRREVDPSARGHALRAPALVSPARKLDPTFPGGGTISPRGPGQQRPATGQRSPAATAANSMRGNKQVPRVILRHSEEQCGACSRADGSYGQHRFVQRIWNVSCYERENICLA